MKHSTNNNNCILSLSCSYKKTPLKQAKAYRSIKYPEPGTHKFNITIRSPAGKRSESRKCTQSVKVEVVTSDKNSEKHETVVTTPFSATSSNHQRNYCYDCRKCLPSQANLFEHNFVVHSQQSNV